VAAALWQLRQVVLMLVLVLVPFLLLLLLLMQALGPVGMCAGVQSPLISLLLSTA
jgi:hypothetical protein